MPWVVCSPPTRARAAAPPLRPPTGRVRSGRRGNRQPQVYVRAILTKCVPFRPAQSWVRLPPPPAQDRSRDGDTAGSAIGRLLATPLSHAQRWAGTPAPRAQNASWNRRDPPATASAPRSCGCRSDSFPADPRDRHPSRAWDEREPRSGEEAWAGNSRLRPGPGSRTPQLKSQSGARVRHAPG
jgi:hypothetical protein